MLSILIPIYNYDVSNLVIDIHKQAIELNIKFEIFLVDDFSTIYKDKNKLLSNYKFVRYEELSSNFGRSKIRNYLADNAKYDNLIFLDCDSGIVRNNFISLYLENLNHQLIYGGTHYHSTSPKNKKLKLHWLYGSRREVLPLETRKKYPNKSFKTNNFLIKKDVFKKIRFNEELKGYGHEDTLFGYELKKTNIKIYHIDNPASHLGLEENDVFLKKTRNGILNLYKLTELYTDEKQLYEDIKLLKYFFKLKKIYFCGLMKIAYRLSNKLIIRNLMGKNPNLKLFDFYKITFLCSKYK